MSSSAGRNLSRGFSRRRGQEPHHKGNGDVEASVETGSDTRGRHADAKKKYDFEETERNVLALRRRRRARFFALVSLASSLLVLQQLWRCHSDVLRGPRAADHGAKDPKAGGGGADPGLLWQPLPGPLPGPAAVQEAAIPPKGSHYGCESGADAGDDGCWAGVYFDHVAQAAILLRPDSSVQAPEGAPGSLRWSRLGGRLTIADWWTGAVWSGIDALRPTPAGGPASDAFAGDELDGDDSRGGESGGGGGGDAATALPTGVAAATPPEVFLGPDGTPRLRRDVEGFAFPGCLYAVEGELGAPKRHVILARNGLVVAVPNAVAGDTADKKAAGGGGTDGDGDDDGLAGARWALLGAGDEMQLTLRPPAEAAAAAAA
ncbi:unnamed protein product, partial [Phaeothamnion confervicola]